jgi:acyl carrier protein
VPVGARGELFIGGAGVGRGYWRRPGLTAERFVPDPFGPDPGGRLYRTGDLARWRATGELEFLGRLDAQVKLRGQRIEPGEIEHALSTHPHIRETAVVLRGAGRRLRLVAYVTAAGKEPPDHAELRQHLLKQLPEHMVPSNFVVLDQFPLLPGGKLDRAALPEPASARPERMAYVPPADPVQEVLAGVWADVLDLDRVGMTDDFFELGGHSLLITQAIYQIRETLRVEFSIRAFLTATTVAELAAAVRDEAAAAGVDVSRAAQLTLEVNAMDQAEVAERLSGRPR